MQTSSLSESMHAIVAEHLAGEFATAGVKLMGGRTLVLIDVGPFQEQTISATLFGDRPCTFDPAEVRGITLTVLDPQMIGRSEMTELGIIGS